MIKRILFQFFFYFGVIFVCIAFLPALALPQKIRGGRTAGTSDSAYIFWGGSAPPGAVGETLEFDGTAFTDLGADMGTAGSSGVCAGTTTAAINIMSGPSPGQNKTQQFNKVHQKTNDVIKIN